MPHSPGWGADGEAGCAHIHTHTCVRTHTLGRPTHQAGLQQVLNEVFIVGSHEVGEQGGPAPPTILHLLHHIHICICISTPPPSTPHRPPTQPHALRRLTRAAAAAAGSLPLLPCRLCKALQLNGATLADWGSLGPAAMRRGDPSSARAVLPHTTRRPRVAGASATAVSAAVSAALQDVVTQGSHTRDVRGRELQGKRSHPCLHGDACDPSAAASERHRLVSATACVPWHSREMGGGWRGSRCTRGHGDGKVGCAGGVLGHAAARAMVVGCLAAWHRPPSRSTVGRAACNAGAVVVGGGGCGLGGRAQGCGQGGCRQHAAQHQVHTHVDAPCRIAAVQDSGAGRVSLGRGARRAVGAAGRAACKFVRCRACCKQEACVAHSTHVP